MMISKLLWLTFAILLYSSIQSQSITDVIWVECQLYPDTTYIKFQNDTLFFKTDLEGFENFSPISIYSIKTDTISISDLESTNQCASQIIGKYKINILNENLSFIHEKDECDERRFIFSNLFLKPYNFVSIHKPNKVKISIYPIPLRNILIVETFTLKKFNYDLFDISGKLMVSGTSERTKVNIETEFLNSGFYTIVVKNYKDEILQVKKLLKI